MENNIYQKQETYTLVFKYPQRTFKEEIFCTRYNAMEIIKDIRARDTELKSVSLWYNGVKIG